MLEGVIFDMDGVLVDSEPAMAIASVTGMKDYGINAAVEDFKPYLGTGEKIYFGRVVEKYGGTYTEELSRHIYDLYCDNAMLHVIPFTGAAETVAEMRKMGFKTALASSAQIRKLEVNIAASRIPRSYFDCIISGSDVVKRKPDPEIFLKAAAGLSLPPKHCIVIEDAVSGVKAAKAAGMACIAITTTYTPEVLLEAGADTTADHIGQVSAIIGGKSCAS